MSEPVHRIRLREPWQTEERAGEILLYRRFGKPTRLEPGHAVWLVFPATSMRRVTINGRELDAMATRWDVTALLEERNQIEVTLAEGDDRSAVTSGVRLEIAG